MKKNVGYFICLFLCSSLLFSQNGEQKFQYNGYLSGMPQIMVSESDALDLSVLPPAIKKVSQTFYQGVVHNRFNLYWYPSGKITTSVQFRNQLLYGDFTKQGEYEDGFQKEGYLLPLTFNQTFDESGLIQLTADRLWFKYSVDKFDFTIGRQRINWGQTFAWNPNDIFNTYNFFDFDYVERPGADAVRLQYYPGYTSTIDVAVKLDGNDNLTSAALFRLNKWGIDFQFIGGYFGKIGTDEKGSDFIGGFGLTTDFKGLSLRTESTYIAPLENSFNRKELLLSSTGVDYTFKNNLFVGAEYLYSSAVSQTSTAGFWKINSAPVTIRNLAYTKHSFFAQTSYPLTPLITAALSAMYFHGTDLKGYYLGPSIDYSLGDNLELALFYQYFYFQLDLTVEITNQAHLGFLRLKWSF